MSFVNSYILHPNREFCFTSLNSMVDLGLEKWQVEGLGSSALTAALGPPKRVASATGPALALKSHSPLFGYQEKQDNV